MGRTNFGPLLILQGSSICIRNLQHRLRCRNAQCSHLTGMELADVAPAPGCHLFHLPYGRTVSIV